MFRLKIGNALIQIGLEDSDDDATPTPGEALILQSIEQLGVFIMSQLEDLNTAITEQNTALAEMKERVAEDVARLEDELSDALAEKPELAEVLAGIRANTASINALDPVPDVDVPTTPETPAEPEVPAEPEAPVDETPVDTTPEAPVEGDGTEAGPVTETPAEEANNDSF